MHDLKAKFDQYQAQKHWRRRSLKRSAVNLLVDFEQQQPQVLMIKRAEREGDPWSGHMAFPGGRFEADKDQNMSATADRETHEEIGVLCRDYSLHSWRLSEVLTPMHIRRSQMAVTPFVHLLERRPEVAPNEEVADVIWIPLSFFLDQTQRTTMQWSYKGVKLDLPCYYYQGHRIWGLSLKMLDEVCSVLQNN